MAEYLGLTLKMLIDIPLGGASGIVALRRAARAVQAGDAEIIACIGADIVPIGFDSFASFSSFSRDHVHPVGAGGANLPFALITASYMRKYGATREDFGRICIAQRSNAAENPHALLRSPMGMDDYLSARPVAEPLHLFDCVMRCNGAEGFLVMSQDRARHLDLPHVTIAGAVEGHNAFPGDLTQTRLGIDASSLYGQAGMGPEEMSFVQAYDDYPVIVALQLEALGYCAPGEAPLLVRERDMTIAGDLPVNTGGGMLSTGQAGAAGGFLGLTEAIRQLTGETVGKAVTDAIAGVVSGYGTVNYDRGLCSGAAILKTAPGAGK